MALDDTLSVQLLRRREVVLLRVDEVTGLEVLDCHLDGKGGVGSDLTVVCGEHKFGGGHDCLGGDGAHGRGVAGATLNLLPVGKRLVDRQAEVDEVIRRRQRRNLACW